MNSEAWIHLVTVIYMVCNVTRVLAYLPQIVCLVRGGAADGVSVSTWMMFAAANGSTAIYALEVQSSAMLVVLNAANLSGNLVVAVLAAWRQRQARDRRLAYTDGGAFYAAAFTPLVPSCDEGLGEADLADAPLLDPVARDQRDPIRLQLRPFDLASLVGIRAARMKRAA